MREPQWLCGTVQYMRWMRGWTERGGSQDDVISPSVTAVAKKIALLYVSACVRKSSDMSPIASIDLVLSPATDSGRRESPDRPFKERCFFLPHRLLVRVGCWKRKVQSVRHRCSCNCCYQSSYCTATLHSTAGTPSPVTCKCAVPFLVCRAKALKLASQLSVC